MKLNKFIRFVYKIFPLLNMRLIYKDTSKRTINSQGKNSFLEKCLAGWNRGMKRVKEDKPFIIQDQPIATQQFVQDVFKYWRECKGHLRNSGKILLISLLFISILVFVATILHPFRKQFSMPSEYVDFSVFAEEIIDVNKDGEDEKVVVISNIPTEFTYGTTKVLVIHKNGTFLELPDEGGEFQWCRLGDFNKNGKTDIAVLYGYSGSAGFGQFYLYEWNKSCFNTLIFRDEIGSDAQFKDIDNDGIEEILYSYRLSKWEQDIQDIYRWDKKKQDYMLSYLK